MIQAPDSIEVATTGGTSGTTAPAWNTTDEATTTDGTVIWTNEQDHFGLYDGPVAERQQVFQWLTADNCRNVASIDQFYVNKAQSSFPIAYRVIGGPNVAPPSDPNTFGNENQTVSSAAQTTTSKQTVKVTDVTSNSLSISGGIDFGLSIAGYAIGLNFTAGGSQDSSTTMSNTTVDEQTLKSQVTNTGKSAASTTIQDSGHEQSIPVNVMQDSIFMGVAVQDPQIHPAPSGPEARPVASGRSMSAELRALPIVPVGHSPATLRKNGSPEPTTYLKQTNYGYVIVVKRPTNASEIRSQLLALHADAAQRHVARPIPAPGPGMVSVPSPRDTLKILSGIRSPPGPVQDAMKSLREQTAPAR